jgi:hypothetical protein
MEQIDHGLIILRPKQPFLDWVNSWSPKDQLLTMEDVQEDAPAILVPEFESDEEALEFVKANATEILMNELSEWCLEPSLWPKKQDYSTLSTWFTLELHSTVYTVGETDDNDEDAE